MFKKSYLGGIIFLMLSPFSGTSQNKPSWQMQPLNIQTRWAKDVDPSRPLPDYPRPQMIRRNNWRNLNGVWEYAIIPKDAPKPTDFQGNILVPYPLESALSGVMQSLLPDDNLWYRRTFNVSSKPHERVLLHFGAIDWQATIFVNGKEIGSHTGGYTAFSFDITDALKSDNNELLVKVYDPTNQGIGNHGKQVLKPGNIYYTPSSGIWQTVWLENVPENYIKSIMMTPDIDAGVLKAKVEAVSGSSVEFIVSFSGKVVSKVRGESGDIVALPIKNAKLWSPDNPSLYDLDIKLIKNGNVLDRVTSYFGMRKIAITKDDKGIDRIFLNNRGYYNLGILDQGFWPDGLYTAPTDMALRFDIEAIKAMGFNTIRKHIKVEPARWYYYADKLGVLVWQDMVNPNQALPEGSKAAFEKESAEVISQLYSYPSITTWVLFNEKWGQYDQERLTKWLKALDSSRIINGHSGELLYVNNELRSPSANPWVNSDVTDVHSYPYPMDAPQLAGKARVLGEFGGIGVPVEGHLWDDFVAGWGYQGVGTAYTLRSAFSKMVDTLIDLKNSGLSASIYTQPFDVESEQNGLMTYDRKVVKLPIDTIRAINSRLWKPSASENMSSDLLSVRIMDTISKSYLMMVDEYRSGRHDSSFLRRVLIRSFVEKKNENTNELMKAYLSQIKNPFEKGNLKLIMRLTNSVADTGFKFMTSQVNRINQTLGLDEAEAKITSIIEKSHIRPMEKDYNKLNWRNTELNLTQQYGALGKETALQSKIIYAFNHKDWKALSESLSTWYETYGKNRKWITDELLNNMSWILFEQYSDEKMLAIAIDMSKRSIQKEMAPHRIDTYANLLFKVGRKKEAIEWEKRAVEISGNQPLFVETLNKMEKDHRINE